MDLELSSDEDADDDEGQEEDMDAQSPQLLSTSPEGEITNFSIGAGLPSGVSEDIESPEVIDQSPPPALWADEVSGPSPFHSRSASTSSLESLGEETTTSSFGRFLDMSTSSLHFWDTTTSSHHSSSAESEGDILNSPPDEYLSFPSLRTSSDENSGFELIRGSRASSPEFDLTPHSSMYSRVSTLRVEDLEDLFAPGTSAGTIRGGRNLWDNMTRRRSVAMQEGWKLDEAEAVDGSEWESRGERRTGGFGRSDGSGGNGGYGNGEGSGGYDSGKGSGGYSGGFSGGSAGRGDDDDGRDDGRRTNRSEFSTPSSSDPSTEEDEDEEDSTDDYGEPSALLGPSGTESNSDDDVPLAQSIPTALKAQRTIRLKAREDKEKRRKDRAARDEYRRSRQETIRPAGAGEAKPQIASSSTQEAALHASRSIHRQRTETLPAGKRNPFPVEDLTRKLQTLQTLPAEQITTPHHRVSTSSGVDPAKGPMEHTWTSFMPRMTSPQEREPSRTLRPMRSFHRAEGRRGFDHSVPLPTDDERNLGRSSTRARSRARDEAHAIPSPPPPLPKPRAATMTGSTEEYRSRPRASEDRGASSKLVKPNSEARSARASLDRASERAPRISLQRSAPNEHTSPTHVNRVGITQQRVFIGDMQRFNVVEVGPTTNAGEVIQMVEDQGSLKGWVGSGEWMLWEVAQDFGMGQSESKMDFLSAV